MNLIANGSTQAARTRLVELMQERAKRHFWRVRFGRERNDPRTVPPFFRR